MLAAASDLDPLAARADEILQRRIQIQLFALLVKIRHLQVAALAHPSGVGGQFAQQHLEQGGFASAVGADQADLVASQDGQRQVASDPMVTSIAALERLVHPGEFRHQFAAGRSTGHLHAHLTHLVAPGLSLRTQGLESTHPALAAGAAGFYPFAHPHLFARKQLVRLGLYHRLLGQLLVFERSVAAVIARIRRQVSAIELDDACCHPIQKGAVVRDHDQAASEFQQQVFEPGDAVQVEVVGRLVQQQHLRGLNQGPRQRHPFGRPAREGSHERLALQAQALQRLVNPLLPVPTIVDLDQILQGVHVAFAAFVLRQPGAHVRQPFRDRVEHPGARIKARLLLHMSAPQALGDLDLSVVWRLQPRQYAQQRRFASAVAANQADPLLLGKRKIHPVQQRQVSIGQMGLLQGDPTHACIMSTGAWNKYF